MVMLGSWRRKKSFPIRFLSYIPEYILWFCVWFLLFEVFDLYEIRSDFLAGFGYTTPASWYKLTTEQQNLVNLYHALAAFIPPAFIFVAYEISHFFKKRYLQKKGLWEPFLRGELENKSNAQTNSSDKTDIGYWHELLQKGAITEEEYSKKKEELL
jgi:hypothetical protein